jgi:hypothetical protein
MADMPEPGENSSESDQLTSTGNLESIGQGPLALILSFLGIKDICRASLVRFTLGGVSENYLLTFISKFHSNNNF